MASIKKRGDYQWRVQIRKKGYPQESKTFNTKADAEKWARMIETEMDRGVFVSRNEAENITISELLDRYLVEVTPQKKSWKNEVQRLNYLKREFGALSLAALQTKHVSAYREKRLAEGRAAATIIKELNSLSHVIDTAIMDWGIHIPANPVKNVRRPTPARGRDRRLASDEETCLLIACRESKSPALEIIVRLALETGMRLGELLTLEWWRVDTKKRVAHLVDTKNGDDRDVPLSTEAVRILKTWPRSIDGRVFPQWLKADSFEHAWRRSVNRARKDYESTCSEGDCEPQPDFLADLRFHDLRHEATTRLFEKGLNPMEVAAVTGHKTLQMLKRYTHLRAEDLAKKLG